MAGDENIIEEDVVLVSPDASGFRRKLNAQLKKEMFGTGIEVPVEFAVKQSAANYVAGLRAKFIQDTFRANQAAQAALARQEERAAARSTILARQVQRERERAEVAATRAAEREVARRERAERDSAARTRRALGELTDFPRIIDYGGRGIRPMNLLYGTVVAMSPALFAMGANAIQASTALTALGSASIGAALGVGGLIVAFQGLGDVLKLRQQVKNEALTKAANDAVKAESNAAKLADAQGEYRTALREERRASDAVHDARVQAARDLETLRRKVVDLNNEYRRNQLDVREASENERAVNRNFFATATQRLRAHQDTLDARTRLGDTRLERRQAQADLRDSIRKGISNADKVIAAQDQYTDAKRRRLRAGHALTNARTGADADAVTKVSSASAQLEQKLKDMAPAARDIYYWFDKNDKSLKAIQRRIAQRVLPGFYQFLKEIDSKPKGGGQTTIELFADAAAELGELAGKYTGLLGRFTKSPLFRKSFAKIQENNAKGFDILGAAALKLLDPLSRILAAAAPLFPRMAKGLSNLVDRFADFIERSDRDGSLGKWFEDAYSAGKKWLAIAGNLVRFVGNLFQMSLPAGGSLVDKFLAFTQSIADWSSSDNGKRAIKSFFDRIANLPFGQIRDFFIQGAALFVAFRTVQWAKANPFLAALAAFAAANPGATMAFMSALTQMVAKLAEFVTKHPNETAFLLALFGVIKAGKTAKVLIEAGGLANLKTTAMSNVVTAAVLYGAQLGWDEFQKGLTFDPSKDTFTTWGDAFSDFWNLGTWYNAIKDNSAVTMAGLLLQRYGPALRRFFSMDLPNFLSGYNTGWAGVGTYLLEQVRDYVGGGLLTGLIDGITGGALSWLYDKLSGWVDGIVNWVKSLFGIRSPSTVFAAIGAMLPAGLWNGFMATWLGLWRTVSGWVDDHIITPFADLFTTGGGRIVDGFVATFGALTTKLAGPVQKVFAWLDSNFLAPLNKLLAVIGVPAIPTIGNGTTNAGKGVAGIIGNVGNVVRRADGGPIPGFSPHSRADNIPAMLTAEEFVQPVAAVKHYGVGFMEAVRQRKLPRYAAGGLVGSLKKAAGDNLLTDIAAAAITQGGTTLAQIASNLGGGMFTGGGGRLIGDQNVAEIAEATARAMGASTKQMVALIEAGIVESGLRNINYGDRDSVGFLQQRPSQGWGTVAQLLNPAYAARKFLQTAIRMDVPGISAGELAARVQRPRADLRYKYGEQEANAVAILNARAPFLPGAGFGGGGSGKYFGTRAGLVAWGRALQQRGYTVSENPAFGSVGTHTPGSQHYRGNAIDVNHGAGTSRREQQYLSLLVPEAHRLGFRTLFMESGHYDHLHADLGPGHRDGGLVRKYDSGGALPPGFTLAYNGTGKTETVRTAEQERALSGPVRLDRRDIAALAAALSGQGITMDGRKVAEVTNRYNYLPAGV